MAKLYITEYARLAREDHGPAVQAGEEPAIAESTIAIGATSTASGVLSAETRFVMIHTDAICHVKIAANAVANTNHRRLPADATVFYGIKPGTELKVAVIEGV